MAKLTKTALAEFDAALDQLGGGVAPIARPPRPTRAKPRKAATSKTAAKRSKPKSAVKRKAGAKK